MRRSPTRPARGPMPYESLSRLLRRLDEVLEPGDELRHDLGRVRAWLRRGRMEEDR